MIEKQYGKHRITLPENIANAIDGVSCLLAMQGYEARYKSSKAPRVGVFKGKSIESDFRLRICFFKGEYSRKKVINFSICKKGDTLTGIHVSEKDGVNYLAITPEEFDNIQAIFNQKIQEANLF